MINIPKIAWLTVNRACQMRCGWCYAGSTGYKTDCDMNLELAQRLATLVKSAGVKTIVIIGGEPTLWKHLFEFNDFCRKLKIKTGLVSNCQRFSSAKFFEEYQQHPSDYVSVSLKAFDQDSSILVSDFRDFEGVKLGIRRICCYQKTQISLVYNSSIKGQLSDMVKVAVDLGATSVRIGTCKPVSINGRFVSTHCIDHVSVVDEVLKHYVELDGVTNGKIRFITNIPLCVWPRDFVKMLLNKKQIGVGGCQFQRHSGVVFDVDGTVILCNSMFDCPVGKFNENFSETQGLISLLNSENVNLIYKRINQYPSEKCVSCEMWGLCRGGCPIMWTVYKPEKIIRGW